MERGPSIRRLTVLGLVLAVPLAAVALYFALFEPAPPPGMAAPPGQSTSAATGGTLPPNHPPLGGDAAEAERHPQMGSAGRTVRVPDAVKGRWQAVRLQVEQKGDQPAPRIFTVKLGDTVQVPGTDLKVQVREFLPALQVKDNEVTSSSNEPTNPAVLVQVSDGEREAFRGWLFGKFPDMQPFEHPRVRITLVEGVPAGG
jgi:hypothetical protein